MYGGIGCFLEYLGYSEDPYPLSMKDVSLSFLLSFLFSSLILVLFSGIDFCSKGTFVSLC